MEFKELSKEKRQDVIRDISKIMSNKYNISNESIDNFWYIVMVGARQEFYYRKYQKVNTDAMYR